LWTRSRALTIHICTPVIQSVLKNKRNWNSIAFALRNRHVLKLTAETVLCIYSRPIYCNWALPRNPDSRNFQWNTKLSISCTNDTIRYDTRCYINVRLKANMSQLNLPHGSRKKVIAIHKFVTYVTKVMWRDLVMNLVHMTCLLQTHYGVCRKENMQKKNFNILNIGRHLRS